jgi:hypothetical protein
MPDNKEIPPSTQSERTRKQYSSVNGMPEWYKHLDWDIGTYRWLIFNRQTNGFNQCLIKIGNRWVIDLDCFENWLEQHREIK